MSTDPVSFSFSSSIFKGAWQAQPDTGDGQKRLSRQVVVGGNFYTMTVGFKKGQIDEGAITKTIEAAERQIAAFVAAYDTDHKADFNVTLQADITQLTGTVALGALDAQQTATKTSLNEMVVTHDSDDGGIKAAHTLIQSFADEYKRTLSQAVPSSSLSSLSASAPATSVVSRVLFPPSAESHATVQLSLRPAITTRPLMDTKQATAEMVEEAIKRCKTAIDNNQAKPTTLSNGRTLWEYKINNTEYVVLETDRGNGCKRWEFDIDGKKYEVNEYAPDAYNGPSYESFVKRAELVFDAAMKKVEDSVDISDSDKQQVLTALRQRREQFFKKEINVDQFKIDQQIKDNNLSDEEFEQINESAVQCIAQFARDAQAIVDAALGGSNGSKFSMSDLEQNEREVVLKRGRPVIINLYSVGGRQFVNVQIPGSKETIPSTIRDRPGLVNYVTTLLGTVDKTGKVSIHFEGIRHGSYSPIRIEDKDQRRAIAAENVRQGLRDIAARELQHNRNLTTSEHAPLVIPLRTMMLVTPLVGDMLRNRSQGIHGKWKGEGETLQLEETYLALRMMHGRAIKLDINGKEVWVRPDISMMNLGANAEAAGIGVFGMAPTHPIQGVINSKGIVEFIDEIEKQFPGEELPPEIRKFMAEIRQLEKVSDVDRQEAEFQTRRQINANESKLQELYGQLDAKYAAYPTAKEKAVLRSQIKKLRTDILALEQKNRKKYEQIAQKRQAAYRENRVRIMELEGKINEGLDAAITNEQNAAKKAALIHFRDLRRNYALAKQLYYTEAYKKPETLIDFQAIYVQTQSMMGNKVEFFCKSAEDRTGRVDDRIQEREVFYALHEHMPYTPEDFESMQRDITPRVHMYSASQNNTEHNSNARGLQISKDVNFGINAKMDKLQATMAKGVISEGKKLQPSPEADRIITNMLLA